MLISFKFVDKYIFAKEAKMLLAIDIYIIPVTSFSLTDKEIILKGIKFSDVKEIATIKKAIVSGLKNGNGLIDLRNENLPSFCNWVITNEKEFI